MLRWRAVAIGLMLGFCAEVAHAQDYESVVQEAVAEFNAGNFEEARALFEHAHRLDANARTLRGLGLCAYERRHYVQAVQFLQLALQEARKALTAEQRDEVEQQLIKARRFVGELTLQVQPETAALRVDGEGTAERRLLLDAGDHSLEIRAPGHHTNLSRVSVSGGQKLTLVRNLTPLDVSPTHAAVLQRDTAPLRPRSAAPEETSGGVMTRWWFWVIAGGVIAAGTATAVVVATSHQAQADGGSTHALLHAP